MSDRQEVTKAVPKIAQLREREGLTQLQLSQLVGVTVPSIQNWERGRAGIEPIERVIKLCKALNCQAEELIDYIQVPVTETETAQTKAEALEKLKKMRPTLGKEQKKPSISNN
ncbi:helix-turn-helix transcriptional regulator [Crocosphaera sp.]|uniref:helix-turn-helix transcriptional regulator n=1 Tax=Crocosphaera sp. TaxID=2729996 RepID=UPI002602D4D0|nr:helix-turn-helix transcriptional regulator [Crocosphaera sp.]MDJ0583010.1 helix-turn-helix transcriptional regulator [Crocosphaera sp.]